MNPLSEESAPAMAIVEGLFRDAVEGSSAKLPSDIRAALPSAFALGHFLLALFWVYDTSPEQHRTRTLLDRGLGLLKLALPLANIPLLRAPLRGLLDLIAEVKA